MTPEEIDAKIAELAALPMNWAEGGSEAFLFETLERVKQCALSIEGGPDDMIPNADGSIEIERAFGEVDFSITFYSDGGGSLYIIHGSASFSCEWGDD